MKKIITILSLIGAGLSPAIAENIYEHEEIIYEPHIDSSYTYWGVGLGPAPFPAVNLSLGRRVAFGDLLGVDLGVNLASIFVANSVRGYVNGLCYLNEKPNAHYIGLGGTAGWMFGTGQKNAGFVAPNFLFGKEFLTCSGNKQFLQLETMYPMYLFGQRIAVPFPLVTLKYGIAF